MEINTPLVITFSFVFFILLLFLVARIKSPKFSNIDKIGYLKQLDTIRLSIGMSDSASNRDAIVRLDALLSDILQKYFNNNGKCGANIKRLKGKLKKETFDELWKIHTLRNRIVHESIEIKDTQGYKSYNIYSEVIKKLLL